MCHSKIANSHKLVRIELNKAYYEGGTWYMDRWYNPPGENNVYSGKDNVYSETQIQCVQITTVCSFHTEQKLEITTGDMDSDKNIRKGKGRGHHLTGVQEDYGDWKTTREDI